MNKFIREHKMKTVTLKRYLRQCTKFEKYGTYTIEARSKEHAIRNVERWRLWNWSDDSESDYGEYQ